MAVTKDKNLKTNPWYFTIEVNENGNRKRIKRRGFKTKKDAEAAQRDLLKELERGLDLQASKTLYKDFMHDWLEDKKASVKGRTLNTYRALVNNHILPMRKNEQGKEVGLGELALSEITPRHIQNLYNYLRENGSLSGENIQKVHTIINESLKKAAGWDMIIKNPAAVVDRPKAEMGEMLFWTDEEAHQFLAAAREDRYYTAFLLAVTTGMRQGELLGLRWQDVDLKSRTISVRQILSHDGKSLEHGAKTASGIRSIGIDRVTAVELEKLQRRMKLEKMHHRDIYEDHDLVICTAHGTPVSPRNLNRSFYRLIEKAGVKKIRFHDLRHSHVVMLLKMRENNKRIAERMGWASVKMLDRYSHITPHMQQETADAFGEMFFTAPKGTKSL
ncbi:site-specific integrase [Paenibacillus flagellatus]|uniref:Site-specific integrase n=1 Tax=Paenibacillus flagellatus TaxID=2211139 RepID=A0A2V5K581_9BACL|nr:site-specific integrase [Paenibacillus flagellatus]PYI54491.1 site-specific integrase [Paenibacillus flagellatus]